MGTQQLLILGCAYCCVVGAQAQSEQSQFDLASRLRLADLQQNSQTGKAGSLLLRGSWRVHGSSGFSGTAEVDAVATVYDQYHSDGVRFNGQPVIPDTGGLDINQLFIQYQGRRGQLRLGRQRASWHDERFLGSMQFWQNEQTFDGLQFQQDILFASSITYLFLNRANRIYGRDAVGPLAPSDVNFDEGQSKRPWTNLGVHHLQAHLLKWDYNEWDHWKWSAFALDIDNRDAPLLNNRTAGVRVHYRKTLDAMRLSVLFAGALQQRPTVENDNTIPYGLAELGVGFNALDWFARYEALGADGGAGFVAPLGSLHEYQGWADAFIQTPAHGVVDQSLRARWRSFPWQLDGRFHHFSAYATGEHFGDELDIDVSYSINKDWDASLRFARFDAAESVTERFDDLQKLIFSLTYRL